MALNPIVATRFAVTFTIVDGDPITVQTTITWPSLTVDYGNEGSEDEPPTRSFVNIITGGYNGQIALILPFSNESIFEQDPLPDPDPDDPTDVTGLRCSVKWIVRRVY